MFLFGLAAGVLTNPGRRLADVGEQLTARDFLPEHLPPPATPDLELSTVCTEQAQDTGVSPTLHPLRTDQLRSVARDFFPEHLPPAATPDLEL